MEGVTLDASFLHLGLLPDPQWLHTENHLQVYSSVYSHSINTVTGIMDT